MSETKRKLNTAKKTNNLWQEILGRQSHSNQKNTSTATLLKPQHFDKMVSFVKGKIEYSDKRTVTQLLILAPPSMSITQIVYL